MRGSDQLSDGDVAGTLSAQLKRAIVPDGFGVEVDGEFIEGPVGLDDDELPVVIEKIRRDPETRQRIAEPVGFLTVESALSGIEPEGVDQIVYVRTT